MNMLQNIRPFLMTVIRDEKGVTAIEYGLITALIAVALVTTLTALSTNLGALFTRVGSDL
jgi:pilus assembly protein Flp/PilA